MDLAIKKAKENGIGWVTCTGECLFIVLYIVAYIVTLYVIHI